MPARKTYIYWTPAEVEILRAHGPHHSARSLLKMLGRHSLEGVQGKLRRLGIEKTPERRRVASTEGILGSAAAKLRCGACGSTHLTSADHADAP